MFRKSVITACAALVIGGAASVAFGLAGAAPARAYDRYERDFERRGQGWRPAPSAFHGYWGSWRWQRWNAERRSDAHDWRDRNGNRWR